MNVCDDVQIKYTGDGTKVLFTFPFEYMEQSDVKVGLLDATTNEYVEVAQDDANHPWSFENATTIRFTTAPGNNDEFKIYRNTEIDYAVFSPGSSIRAQDLNDNFDQIELAIEEGRCADENLIDYVDETYWNKLEDTVYSTEAWDPSDTRIASTQASDDRYLKLAGPGANITTEAEQIAGNVPDDDQHVLSNAASIERHDNIVGPNDPGNQSQEGKLWIENAQERINYWNDTIGAWVDTSQTGPQGPQGDQGPSGTVAVGTTTTGDPGTDAAVTNTGTPENAVLNFTIPRGDVGPQGLQGDRGPAGGGVQLRGQLDATLPNSAPAPGDTAAGDVWFNIGDGVVDASWGAPAAGIDVNVGWRLARTVDDTWEALPPAIGGTEFWVIDNNGVLTTVGDDAVLVPQEFFVGGNSAAPTLRLDPDDSTAGSGLNIPAAGQLGVKVGATQTAVFTQNNLNVGDSIELQGLNETIVVGNMRIDTNQINHNGQWSIDINNNDLIVFRDNDITTIEDLDVEGTAAPGFSLTTTTGIVYRIDAINAGDEAWWASVGVSDPQVGAYFEATSDSTVPANNNITRILNTADLHVSGGLSVGQGITTNQITFPDGTVINGGGGGGVTIGDNPPADPAEGDLWWDSDRGTLFIWYIDPDADANWVEASQTEDIWNRAGGVITPVNQGDGLGLSGDNSGTLSLNANPDGVNYGLTFPATDGQAGQLLSTDGNGNLEWVNAPGQVDGDIRVEPIEDIVVVNRTATHEYVSFLSSGNLVIENTPATFDQVLLVGAGGGGSNAAPGAGGGVALMTNVTLPVGTHTMFLANGGSGAQITQGAGGIGEDSFFCRGSALEVEIPGGGAGNVRVSSVQGSSNGANGAGSQGWGGSSPPFVNGGTGTVPANTPADPGNPWGPTSTVTWFGGNNGGGGQSQDAGGSNSGSAGGAGAAGISGNGNTPLPGGDGVQIADMSPTGTTVFWAGGGGGERTNGTRDPGGQGSAGPFSNAVNGGWNDCTAEAAGANTGSGGGMDGTSGARGIIILRRPI